MCFVTRSAGIWAATRHDQQPSWLLVLVMTVSLCQKGAPLPLRFLSRSPQYPIIFLCSCLSGLLITTPGLAQNKRMTCWPWQTKPQCTCVQLILLARNFHSFSTCAIIAVRIAASVVVLMRNLPISPMIAGGRQVQPAAGRILVYKASRWQKLA